MPILDFMLMSATPSYLSFLIRTKTPTTMADKFDEATQVRPKSP